MKLYVDDRRAAPSGWTLVRSANEAIARLSQGDVEQLSLDYDLGDPNRGTGVDILVWLKAALTRGELSLPKLYAHSGSTLGRHRLQDRIAELEMIFSNRD